MLVLSLPCPESPFCPQSPDSSSAFRLLPACSVARAMCHSEFPSLPAVVFHWVHGHLPHVPSVHLCCCCCLGWPLGDRLLLPYFLFTSSFSSLGRPAGRQHSSLPQLACLGLLLQLDPRGRLRHGEGDAEAKSWVLPPHSLHLDKAVGQPERGSRSLGPLWVKLFRVGK